MDVSSVSSLIAQWQWVQAVFIYTSKVCVVIYFTELTVLVGRATR